MYGWINSCIKSLVLSSFGEEKWALIVEKARCEVTTWDHMQYYADSTTFDLVGAGCIVLGVDGPELLELFGKYFMSYVADNGYDNLLRCLGSNLREWLSNVNMLHVHLDSTLPEMVSPQFWCFDDEEVKEAIILQYTSARGAGLESIVVGVVKEVAASYFHLNITMELLSTQGANGSEFTAWRIRESDEPIVTDKSAPVMTSPLNMTQEAKDLLEATRGQCPFQQMQQRDDASQCPRKPHHGLVGVDVDPVSGTYSGGCPVSSGQQQQQQYQIEEEDEIFTSPSRQLKQKKFYSRLSSKGKSFFKITTSRHDVAVHPENQNITEGIESLKMNCDTIVPSPNMPVKGFNKLNRRNFDSKFMEQHYDHGLSGSQLATSFPFHIVFDRELKILQCGPQLQLFLNMELVGERITSIFQVNRPCPLTSFEEFVSKTKSENVFLECKLTQQRADPLQLTGTALANENSGTMTILCSPNVKNLSELKNQGLTVNDIPKTDCRLEMVLTTEHLQSETNTIAKMTIMSSQLEVERQARMKLMQEAAESAEHSLATKRSFVRYVSHEIRTPLTVSMLGLDLIAQEVNSLGGAEQTLGNIADCQDSITIAVGILNDLLSYEKLESGILELQQEFTPATGFIKQCLKPFKLQARQKGVMFVVDDMTHEETQNPLFCNIDRTKMSQVIRNLASNAIKFTPPGGDVRVVISLCTEEAIREEHLVDSDNKDASSHDGGLAASADQISAMQQESERSRGVNIGDMKCTLTRGGGLLLTFIDSGAGISTDNQGRVFKEIVQFSPNELQAGGGSGLGLWISRGIVDLHKGNIGMKSEGLGRGSTFFVNLPVYGCHADVISGDGIDTKCREASITGSPSGSETTNEAHRQQRKRTFSRVSEDYSGDKSDTDFSVLSGLKMLIVDDSSLIRKMFGRVLRAEGVITLMAEDGEAAIHQVQQLQDEESGDTPGKTPAGEIDNNLRVITPSLQGGELKCFDVILMDSIMPVLDGPSATRILRENGYKGLIIGVTGNMMPADVDSFMEAGVNVVFAKPLEIKKMVCYLKNLSE